MGGQGTVKACGGLPDHVGIVRMDTTWEQYVGTPVCRATTWERYLGTLRGNSTYGHHVRTVRRATTWEQYDRVGTVDSTVVHKAILEGYLSATGSFSSKLGEHTIYTIYTHPLPS